MLDLQTFLLIIGIGNLSFACLMAAYARGPAAQPALRMWMWARVVLGACQIASYGNLQFGSLTLSHIIALGWFIGMALEVSAYCLFFRWPYWRQVLYPSVGVSVVTVAVTQLRGATIAHMIPLISVVVALFAGAMGSILLWPRRSTPALQRIIGANDLLLALSVLAWVGTGAQAGSAQAGGGAALQLLVFLSGYVMMIVKGFGFLLLCKQADDRKMLHLATVDSLTGLLNRHAFFDQAQALRLRHAGSERMVLMMLDLDHFKRINDCFGHATGDEALRLFAHTVGASMAGRGIIGRLGGEEFALALAGATLDEALRVAEQLRRAVMAALLPTSGAPHTVTVSIGVAVLHADEALAAGLARADQAMYDAKRGGRNRVEAARPAPAGGVAAGATAADAMALAPQARAQFCA